MTKVKSELDSFEAALENSMAQAANLGVFNLSTSPINDFTIISSNNMESVFNNGEKDIDKHKK